MSPWEGTSTVRDIEVQARGQRCNACGETVFSGLEVDRQFDEAARAIVERGIRDGEEFAFVRKATKYRAADVAELLDVRPETVSRWERGEAEVPRAARFSLGQLLLEPDRTRRALEAFAGPGRRRVG